MRSSGAAMSGGIDMSEPPESSSHAESRRTQSSARMSRSYHADCACHFGSLGPCRFHATNRRESATTYWMGEGERSNKPAEKPAAEAAKSGGEASYVPRREVGYSMPDRMASVAGERDRASQQIARSLKAWRSAKAGAAAEPAAAAEHEGGGAAAEVSQP